MTYTQIDHPALRLNEQGLFILDQTELPEKQIWVHCSDTKVMIEAIQSLRVRGAPLIGVAACLSLALEAQKDFDDPEQLPKKLQNLRQARPTAVNLMIGLDRMKNAMNRCEARLWPKVLMDLALRIASEDTELCLKMAKNAFPLIEDGDQIITHCNSGALATLGLGTALGAVIYAHQNKKNLHVYVDETRPLLQGGRLSAWELSQANVSHTLICDSMSASLMYNKKITKAFVGSDRIALNGDIANKIGTYSLAVLCYHHKIPFYVVAPKTTVDLNCFTGQQIPIEQRSPQEVWYPRGNKTSPVYNPAFDVTPYSLITAIITDVGVFKPDQILTHKHLFSCDDN